MNDPSPIPAGAIQIEDDDLAPAVSPPPAPAAPADPPAPVSATPDDEIDLDDPELAKDQKRISGLIAELSRKREEVRTLKPKASEAEQWKQRAQESQPYVEFLRANPQLMQARPPDPVPAPVAPQDDQDALEAARLYDFYTAEGKPDAVRGRRHLDMVQKQAERLVQQHVQPIQQGAAYQQAQANYQSLLTWKDPTGAAMVDKKALDGVWSHMIRQPGGLETLATREGALTAAATARGFAGLTAAPVVPPPAGPPLHTEPSGGQIRPRTAMSEQTAAIAKERNWTAEKYQKLTREFVKGRPTQLEDE